MATPSAPSPISLNDVNVELGNPGTTLITLNDTAVRTLAGPTFATPGTTISLNDLRGKSSFSVTGGNVNGLAPGNGYKYHTFTSPGTFTVTGSKSMEILLVGGGGGTGPVNDSRAGGGGAGGLVYWSSIPLSTGSYTVTVGGGGAAATGSGGKGTPTVFGPGTPLHLVALGGGTGGSGPRGSMVAGQPGGSGGGGSGFASNTAPGSGVQTTDPTIPTNSRTYGFGFPGNGGGGPVNGGGGGGGAGEAGNTDGQHQGGDGRQYPAFTGPLIGVPALNPLSGYYAGGGGGDTPGPPSASDGGGGSGSQASNDAVTPGTQYSGGGAGGTGDFGPGATGGSGIVIIRYLA